MIKTAAGITRRQTFFGFYFSDLLSNIPTFPYILCLLLWENGIPMYKQQEQIQAQYSSRISTKIAAST